MPPPWPLALSTRTRVSAGFGRCATALIVAAVTGIRPGSDGCRRRPSAGVQATASVGAVVWDAAIDHTTAVITASTARPR